MCRDLYEADPLFQETVAAAEARLPFALRQLCFEGPQDELTLTLHAQPALLAFAVACWRVLDTQGVAPAVVAGHSLGEYSALVAAGVLEFESALDLVALRARLMHAAPPGAMAAVLGADQATAEALCEAAAEAGVCQIANLNSPEQVVLSGAPAAIDEAVRRAQEFGARRAVRLSVSGAFHSPLMAAAADRLATALADTQFSPPTCPVVPNATARWTTDPAELREALARQMTSRVLWVDSVRTMLAHGVSTFVEVGPGRVLSGLVKRIDRSATVYNVQDTGSLDRTLKGCKQDG